MADVITRLKLESGEYDSKIKRATQGLLQMEQECRKVGGTLAVLEKDQMEFVKSLGQMQTVSTSVRGKIGELSSAYTELRSQYNRLTNEEKKGDFGRALSSSLDQLKVRIKDSRIELESINKELSGLSGSKFGEFGNIIDTLGSKMGVTGNLTEMLTSKTALMTGAIGASVAIVAKATEAWAGYNAELAKQDQMTTVITGLKGDDADRMTDSIRAMVDTYNVDFRQAVEAANTLMAQFGESGDSAISLLRDGLQGMIQGDGPKLLQMIQQYAPAFHDAGVSASQLIAVIQNSEGGIFTSENMQAIVMGIKNIRLMTKQTSDALAQLGIDGEKMTQQMSDGTMTVFDALKEVAGELQDVGSGSQEAGQVMQAVFGRQGAMAGTNLAKAIETLNLNLAETKTQTGDVGKAYDQLYEANKRLESAIRECFGYDGWEQMATGLKTKLYTALANVLDITIKIKDIVTSPIPSTIFDTLTNGAVIALGPLGKAYGLLKLIKGLSGGGDTKENIASDGASVDGAISVPTRKRAGSGGFLGDDDTRVHPGLIVKPETPKKPTGGNRSNIDTQQQRQDDRIRKQYEDAMRKAEREIVLYAGEISTAIEVQKKIDKANRDLEAAQKRLADAQRERSVAKESGDLKAYYSADKKVTQAQEEVTRMETVKVNIEQGKVDLPDMPKDNETVNVNFKATAQNIDAQIAHLKDKMSQLQIGSIEFKIADTSLVDMTTLQTIVNEQLKAGLTLDPEVVQSFFDQISENKDIADKMWDDLLEKINAVREAMDLPKLNIDKKTGKKVTTGKDEKEKDKTAVGVADQMVGGISQMTSSLEKLGIDIPAGFAGVLSGISGVVGVLQAIQIICEAIEAMQTVGSFLGIFANGGIVPHAASGHYVGGGNYSGDTTPILANAGELILNKAEQGNLATQLEGTNIQNLRLEATVKGEDIRLSLNNNGRRRGRGEYVTTKFVRG